jgi:hypothetical protein
VKMMGSPLRPSHATVTTNCVPAGTGPTTTFRTCNGAASPLAPAPAGAAVIATTAAAATVTPIHPIDFRTDPPELDQPPGSERHKSGGT